MTSWPYPFWIAHRGAGKLAPENTLAAFRVGAGYGYRAFECDVKLSVDGVPFLLHDDTLERTTPEQGPADQCSWAQLSRMDAGGWHSRGFAGEPIASFDAIAKYCIRNGFALNIEVKPSPGREDETGRVVARASAHLWHGQVMQPLLSSFDTRALASVLEAAPQLPRALLLENLRINWLEEAKSLGCIAVVCAHRQLTADAIDSLHSANMRSLAYTVNDLVDAQRLRNAGIDGLITDALERFSPIGPTPA